MSAAITAGALVELKANAGEPARPQASTLALQLIGELEKTALLFGTFAEVRRSGTSATVAHRRRRIATVVPQNRE